MFYRQCRLPRRANFTRKRLCCAKSVAAFFLYGGLDAAKMPAFANADKKSTSGFRQAKVPAAPRAFESSGGGLAAKESVRSKEARARIGRGGGNSAKQVAGRGVGVGLWRIAHPSQSLIPSY
jgi:hypothetical protein